MVAGTTLSLDTISAVIGFVLIVLAVWLKLREEEALLTKHFSEAYVAYKEILRPLYRGRDYSRDDARGKARDTGKSFGSGR